MSCKSGKNITKQLVFDEANSIALERTACFGTCPVYQVIIFADGTINYEGRNHVNQIGFYTGTLDKKTTLNLFIQVADFSWDAYPDKYPIDNYDFPQFNISYKANDKMKLVKANSNAADELIALSKKIDKLLELIELRKE